MPSAKLSPSGTSYSSSLLLPRRLLLLFLSLLFFLLQAGVAVAGQTKPNFIGEIDNVTAKAGSNAVLECTVEMLRGYKVAWVQVETQTILTIHNSVITRNPRVGLSHEGTRVYRLHLKNVTETDRGYYMCQINTDPMISQSGFLQVVVPPDIEETAWGGDLVVREGSNVSLECRARGYPPPTVTWNREMDNSPKPVRVLEGEVMSIPKVSRLDMGAYLCVAANEIPPTVSKRVKLMVQFPPMLWIPNQLEGARLGSTTVLECNTEAYPRSINYWTNHRGEMIPAGGPKYDTMTKEESYKTYMRLEVRNLTKADFNTYRCIAKNSLGETDGSIKLYEIEPRPERPTKGPREGGGGGGGVGGGGVDPDNPLSPPIHGEDYDEARDRDSNTHRGHNRGKGSHSRKTGQGGNSRRTGDAVNDILSGVDKVFRNKDKHQDKDHNGYGLETSFDPGFFDSATPRNSPSLPVFFASVFFASVFFIAEEL